MHVLAVHFLLHVSGLQTECMVIWPAPVEAAESYAYDRWP